MSSLTTSWHKLQFPSLLEPEHFEAFLRAVYGMSTPGRGEAFVFQLSARAGQIEHYLGVPPRRLAAVAAQLHTINGLVAEPVTTLPEVTYQAAWRFRLTSSRRPLRSSEPEITARTLLAAIKRPARQ